MPNFSLRLKKRDNVPLWEALLHRVIAILISLIVCGIIIIAITKLNPFQVYGEIVKGALGSKTRFWVTIRDMLVLMLVAVGLVPAFKMRFWNIGAEGQILMGALASAALMIYGTKIPQPILLPMIIVGSCVAGMIWGVIPAFFKAKFNTNETLFTLMMNYIAMQIITFGVVLWEVPKGSNSVGIINPQTNLGWFPIMFGQKYILNIILVVIVTVLVALYIKYTKHGYEVSVVGESWDTARYSGINVKTVIIRTMALSGAICGLAGCLVVSGASHTISSTLSGGRGFTAIIVTWMANFNSFGMAAISFILTIMEKGAGQIASKFGLNQNMSDIMTGIMIFFLIGSEFFVKYKVVFQKESKTQEDK